MHAASLLPSFQAGHAAVPSSSPPAAPWCLARRRPLFPACERQLIRFFQVFSLVAGFAYVAFRWVTLLRSGLWAGGVFVVAETVLICLVQPAHVMMTWRPLRRDPLPLERVLPTHDFPSVDVLIPCYTEPVEVVEQTLRAALRLAYPGDRLNVFVLDDGNSPDVRRMVERVSAEHQAAAAAAAARHTTGSSSRQQPGRAAAAVARGHYIARVKEEGVPHHAKAGNVNHALFESGLTHGQLVLILDCDMVCLPAFLNMTVAHFYRWDEAQARHVIDPAMALVQTPQDFFNLVPSVDVLGQRYLAFYDFLMPCWEGHNTVPCCGTNVVFSRAALASIGGLSTVTITEDVHTSMKLTAAGYRSAYVNEHMAFGLVPTDIQSYCKQRRRWAIGSLQIFLRDPPFLKRGLSLRQRLLYTWLNGQYLLCVPYLVLTALPLIYLTSPDLVLNKASIYDYLAFFLPYYVPLQLVGLLSSRDVGLLYWLRGQQETVYNLWTNLEAVLLVFANIRVSFSVTPKHGGKSPLQRNLPFVLPHLTYCCVALASFGIWGLMAWHGRLKLQPSDLISYSVAMLATVTVTAYMCPPIAFCFRPSPNRKGFSPCEPHTFDDFLALEAVGEARLLGYGMGFLGAAADSAAAAAATPLLQHHHQIAMPSSSAAPLNKQKKQQRASLRPGGLSSCAGRAKGQDEDEEECPLLLVPTPSHQQQSSRRLSPQAANPWRCHDDEDEDEEEGCTDGSEEEEEQQQASSSSSSSLTSGAGPRASSSSSSCCWSSSGPPARGQQQAEGQARPPLAPAAAVKAAAGGVSSSRAGAWGQQQLAMA